MHDLCFSSTLVKQLQVGESTESPSAVDTLYFA